MKTVRLPIFEDGLELEEYLEIDITHFLGAAGSEIAHNNMRVVQHHTPEEEKEMIDRIISGLPPKPNFEGLENELLQGRLDHVRLYDVSSLHPQEYRLPDGSGLWDFLHKMEKPQPSAHFSLEQDGTITELVKPEDVEWATSDINRELYEGKFEPIDEWRDIPNFSFYEIHAETKQIREVKSRVEIPIQKGRIDSALLRDDNCSAKRMSVKFLHNVTFPELKN